VPWAPREAQQAICYSPGPRGRHHAPKHYCGCGLYAFNSIEPDFALNPAYVAGSMPNRIALGAVSLWGKVLVCTRGYRAEFAYPRSISVILRHEADPVASRYQ
jgi:hypothetical protein